MASGARTCTIDDNVRQAEAVRTTYPGARYAEFAVKVLSYDAKTRKATFSVDLVGASSKPYTEVWDHPNVWPSCPTTIDVGSLPPVGATGTVMIGGDLYDQIVHDAPMGSPIPVRKWPNETALALSYVKLELEPSSLIITIDTGTSTGGGLKDIEMWNPTVTSQLIDIGGLRTDLVLPGGAVERGSITKVILTGKYKPRGTTIELDLRDPAYSNPSQIINLVPAKLLNVEVTPLTVISRLSRSKDRRKKRPGGEVTYIAAPTPLAKGTPITALRDGNNALAQIESKLKLSRMTVIRVSTINEVFADMRERQPSLAQVVGHSSPGFLALGFGWKRQYSYALDAHGVDLDYCAVDSNPYLCDGLYGAMRAPVRLVLCGCFVGSPSRGTWFSTGRSVLFGLHDVSNIEVRGADGLVSAESFVGGIYEGSYQGIVEGEWTQKRSATELHPRLFPPSRPPAPAPNIQSATFHSVSMEGRRFAAAQTRGRASAKPPPVVDPAIFRGYSVEVSFGDNDLLALDEVAYDAIVDGDQHMISFVCGMRFMRMGGGKSGVPRYFQPAGALPMDTFNAVHEHRRAAVAQMNLRHAQRHRR